MRRAEEMNAFIVSVDAGGFSAAARKLALTPSAISKLVSRLEDRLGSRLFNRTTRSLRLTVEGEAYYNRIRPILAAMSMTLNHWGRPLPATLPLQRKNLEAKDHCQAWCRAFVGSSCANRDLYGRRWRWK